MMVVLMPMAGKGFFGLGIGWMAPVMTLMLHLIFGAVLGWVYGRQASRPIDVHDRHYEPARHDVHAHR